MPSRAGEARGLSSGILGGARERTCPRHKGHGWQRHQGIHAHQDRTCKRTGPGMFGRSRQSKTCRNWHWMKSKSQQDRPRDQCSSTAREALVPSGTVEAAVEGSVVGRKGASGTGSARRGTTNGALSGVAGHGRVLRIGAGVASGTGRAARLSSAVWGRASRTGVQVVEPTLEA